MLDWLKRKTTFTGSVLFRGSLPPKPAEFLPQFQKAGIQATQRQVKPPILWGVSLKHPEWGTATLFCTGSKARPSRLLIEHSRVLTNQEEEEALSAECELCLRMDSQHDSVLRDRKMALRFLRTILGDDGVAACDYLALRVWSRTALDEELSHDADLDIGQIIDIHCVKREEGETVDWMHTHGLAEIGFFDFDVVNPSEDLLGLNGTELFRAIAFAIVEEKVSLSTPRYGPARPGGMVRMVEASAFQERANPQFTAIRDDPSHNRNRVVLCEPAGRLFGRWSRKVEPSRFFSGPISDEILIDFTHDSSRLMADRARHSFELFKSLADELAEFEVVSLVKLGYRTDGAKDETDKEHLWFQVHGWQDGTVDATLINKPISVSSLAEGARGRHPVDLLSDWTIISPAGPITPRDTSNARLIRENRDRVRMMMAMRRKKAYE